MIDFYHLLGRANEITLQEILGSTTMKLLRNIDPDCAYNQNLRELILQVYGPEGLLLNKNHRALLLELLKENEARSLSKVLGLDDLVCLGQLYDNLKKRSFVRGSKTEETLFKFFNIEPPEKESRNEVPSLKEQSGKYQLFSHQRVAVRRLKNLLLLEPHRVLLHMPTGSGKTRTAMSLLCDILRNSEPCVIIWLAATEELCEQAAEEFEKAWSYLGDRPVGVHRFWDDHELDPSTVQDGIVVMGLPKVVRTVLGKEGIMFLNQMSSKSSLIVMDEAHQAIAQTYEIVIESLFHMKKGNKLIGLSATPGRTWNDVEADRKLADFFARRKVKLEVEAYDSPVDYLVAQGYLANVSFRQLFYDLSEFTNSELDELERTMEIPRSILKRLGEDEQRNINIIYQVEQLAKRHRRIILFAPSVESSNILAFVLQARGYCAYSVTGETPSRKRRDYIDDFKNEDVLPKILCNYGVLTTGFDAPQTSAAIIARPTLSLVLYSQMVGRAIRGEKAGGNREAEIITIVDTNLPGFQSVTESFENWEDVWE